MANEATVRSSLLIRVGNLAYQSQPTSFTADVSTSRGPTPGLIIVPTTGVEIVLTALVRPGLCRIMNLDPTNYVEVGIYDQALDNFYPILQYLPGMSFPLFFSENLLEEHDVVGTGTSGPTKKLWARAHGGTCNLLVEAFER